MKSEFESKELQSFNEESPCPYFYDGRISSIEYVVIDALEEGKFQGYLSKGYRRLGRIIYRNVCEDCKECRPLRIEAGTFLPGKSQKRTIKKNHDIKVEISETSQVTAEKILLFHSYVRSKHPDNKDKDLEDSINTLILIHYGYGHTLEMDYFIDDKLVGVGIVDRGIASLSSNYFYYDTRFLDRRLGIFSILKEIELTRELGLKHYYLGFYIEDNSKMSYKKYFRPNQVLDNREWIEFVK